MDGWVSKTPFVVVAIAGKAVLVATTFPLPSVARKELMIFGRTRCDRVEVVTTSVVLVIFPVFEIPFVTVEPETLSAVEVTPVDVIPYTPMLSDCVAPV